MNIKRTIAYYEKNGEDFLGEYMIEAGVETLRKVVPPFSDDPEYYMSYPLKIEHRPIVMDLFGIDMELEIYDYFLECSQI